MDLSSYLAARELVIKLGQPLLYFSFTLSLLLIALGFHPQLRKFSRHLRMAVFLSLLSGFFLILWFHYRIYNAVPLIDPFTGKIAGRYAIAPWTDNEKLFFWTLLTSIWLLLIKPRIASFDISLNVVLALFVSLTVFTSNPFVSPLNSFNEQLTGVSHALQGADSNTVYQYFEQAKAMLESFYNSAYMWIHPPLLFLAYSTFVVSFFGSVFMLVKKNVDYERFAYVWAKPGYIVLTLGLLIGYPWTIQAWEGQPWWFSPKVNITLMMWVLYTAYLHTRLYLHRRGMFNATAIMGILSFSAVVATYISTYVLPGIHSVKGY